MKLAEFAALAGVSRAAITQAVGRERLKKNADGGIDEKSKLAIEYLSTIKRQRRQPSGKSPAKSRQWPAQSSPPSKPPEKRSRRSRRVDDPDETEGETYNEAERRDKIAAANLKEQKLEMQRGELLPRTQIKLVLSKIYAIHRAQLKTLGERIGPDLTATLGVDESKALVVQSAVDEDVRLVLQQIKAELYAFLESIGDGEELKDET